MPKTMEGAQCYLPSPRLCRVVIALLAVLVWGQTVHDSFVWDDHYFIVENTAIRSLKNIPAMFYSRIAEASHPSDFPNFRPLRNVAYALLLQLGGKTTPQPWIFHLANVLGHAAAALLVFSTAALLFLPAGEGPARWAALFTGAAFAVHPAASEVVCWAKSLDDILAAIFVLAAARELLLWHGEKRRLAAALAFFAVAVYAKESAVPFAGLVFFLGRACHKLPWKRCAMLTAPFLLVAAIYMTHRSLVLGHVAQCPPISGAYGQTVLDTIPAVSIYFRLLWGIPPFSIDYSDMHGHLRFFSVPVLAGLFLLLLWAVATVAAWRYDKFRPAALGLLWLGFFLLPVSNLLPMLQYLAERFLYLPLIGWLLFVGAVLAWSPRRLLLWGLAPALLAVWLPVTLARQRIWRDDLTLFVRSSLDNPANSRLRGNAVSSIFQLPLMNSCFWLDDTTRLLRATASIPRRQAEAMLPTLSQYRQILPDEGRLTSALIISYAAAGQISNAVPILELAARKGSNNVQCWLDLGTAYALEGNAAHARQAWETAVSLEPTNRFALEHLRALKAK
jgi:tetratricopeptide (TPR) repeat protein